MPLVRYSAQRLVNNGSGIVLPIPSWVPAAGEVATYTGGGAVLTNNFRDVVHSHFTATTSVKIANDYCGAFKNPHYGGYGCAVYFGGGHAATNDNSVILAEYGEDTITFVRACDPTQWTGGNPDTGDIDSQCNATYAEATSDGKPCAPHNYGSGEVLGPTEGGAAHGTFLQVVRGACNVPGFISAQVAHKLDFANTTDGPSVRNWARWNNNVGALTPWTAPFFTAHVSAQSRVYIQTNGDSADGLVRWWDRATGTYVRGTGTTFGYDGADGFDGGALFPVPERNLLVCMFRSSGNLTVQWMDVSVSQPTLGGTATLSSALAVPTTWSAACWCKDNSRIIVGDVTGDTTAVHEITIPATLTNTWTVTRQPFGASQSISWDGVRCFRKWSYDEKVKAIVYHDQAAPTGDDTVKVYRPVGT